MPSLPSIALAFAASFAVVQAEHLRVVWSAGTYGATTSPFGGGVIDHYDDFAIIRDDGEAVYTESYPYGYVPCRSVGGGRTFEICGDCWDSCFRFNCLSNDNLHPRHCEVQDGSGNVIDESSATTDTDYIGIAIGIDATCVVEFESDGGGCPIDDGNGPLHAQGENV